MNEPKRLREQGAEGAELLQAARNFEPPARGRDRLMGVLQAGGVAALATTTTSSGAAAGAAGATAQAVSGAAAGGGTAGATGGTAGAVASGAATGTVGSTATGTLGGAASGTAKGGALLATASKLLSLKPLLIVAGVGAAGAATVVAVTDQDPGAPASEARDSNAASGPSASSKAGGVKDDEQSPGQRERDTHKLPAAATTEREAEPDPEKGTPASRAQHSPKPPPAQAAEHSGASASLQDELKMLKRARTQLRSGDAQVALSTLREHRARFPSSSVSLEREVLSIEALQAAGQTARAQKRARAFVERHPQSMLAERLRPLLGTDRAPPDSAQEDGTNAASATEKNK